MEFLKTRKYSRKRQYALSLTVITITAVMCFFLVNIIGYKAVALLLLLAVSLNAVLFDIFPVMFSALLSALIWNFFFIPPVFTLTIATPEDALLLLMYFVIASINAVLTYKIREFERKERDEEEREKALQLYNTLFNSLSHELKTPLSTIIGSIDTIKCNQSHLSEANKELLYTEIEIAAVRLTSQVENLLSMSRLEAGFIQPKVDWCDLNELVFSVIHEVVDDSRNHDIHFSPNELIPLCKIDGGLMDQILKNLVHNAIQHTPIGSEITIEFGLSTTECFIYVSDSGKGFPENESKHVFEKFYRLKHSSTGGTGLGLSIVKGLTEAMNGKVKLEKADQGGAKFTIQIPCEFSNTTELEYE